MSTTEMSPISIEQLRAGDGAAFVALVRQCSPRLLAVARRYLRCEEEARDAVQETFVSAFRALAGFRDGCRIETWLYRIAVNHCLMRLRRRRTKAEQPFDDHSLDESESRRARDSDNPVARLETKQTQELVHAAIDRLPEGYRKVLLLRDIEEMDQAEAATCLGVSTTVVKVRLHRARKALRALLEPQLCPEPSVPRAA